MNKKKESKVVPNVRFKGFTDDWKQCKLNEVLSFLKDGTHGTHADDENGPLLLSAKNIKNGKIICDETDRRISEEEYEKIHTNFSLEVGDVLLTIVGSIGETAILKDCSSITFQRSVAFLRPNGTITSDFLYSEIQTQKFQNELDSRKSTSAQPGIYLGDLSEVPIVFTTNLDEQTKIGDYFNNLDHLITLHQQKITLLTKLKKAMLEKMFPKKGTVIPEFRFNGFANAWEQRKLSDVVDSVDTGKSKFDKEGSSGEYPILGSTSVIGYDDEYDYEGDFILTARVGANAGSLYRHAGKVKISDNTVFIQASQNIEFLYQLLIRFDIKRLSFGTGQPLVKASELKRLELMMPTNMEEQMRIGVYFKNLDHLITLHQRKIDKIKNMKKAMLDQMFI